MAISLPPTFQFKVKEILLEDARIREVGGVFLMSRGGFGLFSRIERANFMAYDRGS